MTKIGGIHCVLYALFDKTGALDLGAMRAQASLMVDLGVDGITVLGLATEVGKLRETERQDLVDVVAAEVAGQVPFSVTITGNSIAEQRSGLDHAVAHGADWVILQPPLAGQYSGPVYLDFFTSVAQGFETQFALQNAPEYLGSGLTSADIKVLQSRIPNFAAVKAEAPAIVFADIAQALPDEISMLNGRGGLQMMDCLMAGADGFVLAPDAIDAAIHCFGAWQAGDETAAASYHSNALPSICFVMQSLEHLICYGKRLFGMRAGFQIHDRQPCLKPTEFGRELVRNHAKKLGPFASP